MVGSMSIQLHLSRFCGKAKMQLHNFSIRVLLLFVLLTTGSWSVFAAETSNSFVKDSPGFLIASDGQHSDNSYPDLPDCPIEERNEKEETKTDSDKDDHFECFSLGNQVPANRLNSSALFVRASFLITPIPLYRLFHCWKAFC